MPVPRGRDQSGIIMIGLLVLLGATLSARGGDVTGRVAMPATCSPSVSPAVVWLTPEAGGPQGVATEPGRLALVGQQGLRFEPRVQALTVGQPLRFTNADPESHSVHILGTPFSRSMPPGGEVEFVPEGPGVLKVVCDVHTHMRAFLVVAPTPLVATCDRDGRFLLADVPPGRYALDAWHEVGDPLRRTIEVGDATAEVGTLTMAGPPPRASGAVEPARPWSEVIDCVGLAFAASLDAAAQPGGRKRAKRLAQDAYFVEFEASGMETAVGRYLGLERSGAIERQFRDLIRAVGALEEGEVAPAALTERVGLLLMDLNRAAGALDRDGITDRLKLAGGVVAGGPAADVTDRWVSLAALRRAFDGVRERADAGAADDAASAMSDAYFDAFEPLERALLAGDPAAVPRLEARFNALRGRVGAGQRGEALAADLDGLARDVAAALDRVAAGRAGAFGTAFLASAFTITREGVEVILILTMLLALVAKSGRPGDARAIRWGLAAGLVASFLTALALNGLVAGARGRAGEFVEGVVMLVAAGVLFYVSYWLISQAEARRWTDFLKRQVRGAAGGRGLATLGLTAFLAVYREGAETALMYQAMLGTHGTPTGSLGLLAGAAVGLVALAGLYWCLRTASVRLPLRSFFAATGAVLFAMAVTFAGQGVFELQQAQILKITPLAGLGEGLPLLGFYPNVQVASIQGLLVAAAALSWALLATTGGGPGRPQGGRVATPTQQPTVGVGA